MAAGFVESPAGHVFRVSVLPSGHSAWTIKAVCARADGSIPSASEAQADLAAMPEGFRAGAARAILGGRAHYGFADAREGAAWAEGREETDGYVKRRAAA